MQEIMRAAQAAGISPEDQDKLKAELEEIERERMKKSTVLLDVMGDE